MAKKKLKILLLALLPLILLGFLAFRAFDNSAAYYYTISEASAQPATDQKLRLKGLLVEESVDYNPGVPLLKFALSDDQAEVEMVYAGILPDNFQHADSVIVEGKFNSQGEFVVSKLMLQCPSKYEGGQ